MLMADWERVVMAGLGSAAAVIDPSLPGATLAMLLIRAFIGGAVGAYFGNHISKKRKKA